MAPKTGLSLDQILGQTNPARARRWRLSPIGYGLLAALGVVWSAAGWIAAGGALPGVLIRLLEQASPAERAGLTGALATVVALAVGVLDHQRAAARAEARRMRRTASLLADLLDAFPVGLILKDAALRFVWVNAEHSRLGGHDPANLFGKTVAEVLADPVLAAGVTAHDRRVLATGEASGPEEQVLPGPDGKLRHITMVTKLPVIQDGQVTHIMTFSADQMSWRDSQLRSETTRRLLETVMEAAPATILVTDLDGTVRWANHAFRETLAEPNRSPIGRKLSEIASSISKCD